MPWRSVSRHGHGSDSVVGPIHRYAFGRRSLPDAGHRRRRRRPVPGRGTDRREAEPTSIRCTAVRRPRATVAVHGCRAAVPG